MNTTTLFSLLIGDNVITRFVVAPVATGSAAAMSLLLVSTLAYSAAPESIAGKVYRDYTLFSGVTNASESTIIIGRDGRYDTLKKAFGTVSYTYDGKVPDVHWGAIQEPRSERGIYRYVRSGDDTGSLTFIPDAGAASTLLLRFTSLTSGSSGPSGLSDSGRQIFYLTDLPDTGAPPVSNVSLRGRVAEGSPLITGFSVGGRTQREVLIRVVGPTLASFGVPGVWNETRIQIYRGDSPVFGATFQFPYWSERTPAPGAVGTPEAGLRRIFEYVGAFPLPSGSKDSAVVIRFAPGNYTVVAEPRPGDPGGEALIEIYVLP